MEFVLEARRRVAKVVTCLQEALENYLLGDLIHIISVEYVTSERWIFEELLLKYCWTGPRKKLPRILFILSTFNKLTEECGKVPCVQEYLCKLNSNINSISWQHDAFSEFNIVTKGSNKGEIFSKQGCHRLSCFYEIGDCCCGDPCIPP